MRAFLYRDIPYLGSFRSSDPRVDSIWMTGAYTLHLNLQEYLVEAPKRDRLVYGSATCIPKCARRWPFSATTRLCRAGSTSPATRRRCLAG